MSSVRAGKDAVAADFTGEIFQEQRRRSPALTYSER